MTSVCGACLLSRTELPCFLTRSKRNPGIDACVLRCLSFDALSDVTVVLEMRQSIDNSRYGIYFLCLDQNFHIFTNVSTKMNFPSREILFWTKNV